MSQCILGSSASYSIASAARFSPEALHVQGVAGVYGHSGRGHLHKNNEGHIVQDTKLLAELAGQ